MFLKSNPNIPTKKNPGLRLEPEMYSLSKDNFNAVNQIEYYKLRDEHIAPIKVQLHGKEVRLDVSAGNLLSALRALQKTGADSQYFRAIRVNGTDNDSIDHHKPPLTTHTEEEPRIDATVSMHINRDQKDLAYITLSAYQEAEELVNMIGQIHIEGARIYLLNLDEIKEYIRKKSKAVSRPLYTDDSMEWSA